MISVQIRRRIMSPEWWMNSSLIEDIPENKRVYWDGVDKSQNIDNIIGKFNWSLYIDTPTSGFIDLSLGNNNNVDTTLPGFSPLAYEFVGKRYYLGNDYLFYRS